MRKILIVPGNLFVSRNYFSSPLIENLKRISIKDEIKIIVAEVEGNPIDNDSFERLKRFFEENNNIQFVKLVRNPISLRERTIWYLKNNFLHKSLTFRFNEMNNFITHKRYKDITKTSIKKEDTQYLWNSDIWPRYLGFPFPKSKMLFKFIFSIFTSFIFSKNRIIENNFKNLNPDLLILGDIQSPVSFSYSNYAKKYKVKTVGSVRTWDHLTKNGPVIKNLDEYWVWNPVMREELIKFHNINDSKIFEIGSPQFDYYLNNEIDDENLIEYFNIKKTNEEFSIDDETSVIFFATNRPHRGIGEESIIHHICENIALGIYPAKDISLVLRSHPHDKTFMERFKEFKKYPFVRLFNSSQISNFDPIEFRDDMIKVNLLLKKSKLVICGQSTFAIDSACTDTPIINISFEGDVNINEKLSVKNRYNVDHYQKLISYNGTKLVDDFDSLDNSIEEYLIDPAIDNDGRKLISKKFAGFSDKSSSEKITERILKILDGGNGRI
ncbi:MAG: hypothetical protein CBC30_04905 [Chloroflexi bacterium TMED70]|nr:hypothetical protein [Gammaproteobacteria bacterium]OUU75659.1 MAG: hypothetical protein CBC30_04905 [Chloroflexi bacterium TMED70]